MKTSDANARKCNGIEGTHNPPGASHFDLDDLVDVIPSDKLDSFTRHLA